MGTGEGNEPARTRTVSSRIGDARNVLLLASALDAPADHVCTDLLTLTDPGRENILWVTVTRSAEDKLRAWQQHVDDAPARMGMITVGEGNRSASAHSASSALSGHSIRRETVADPRDLTGLGIALSTVLADWDDTGTQPVVCFDSITPLLQYVDPQHLFRFLHVLTGRIDGIEAVAHYHLDPSAHDQQTTSTFKQLVDTVIEASSDGELDISRR